MTVTARKVGNSTTVTIPKDLEVPNGAEFDVSKDNQGNIIFTRIEKFDPSEIEMFMGQFQPLMEKLKDR